MTCTEAIKADFKGGGGGEEAAGLPPFPFNAPSATFAFALACADWDDESWSGAGRGLCFLLRLEEEGGRAVLGAGLRGAKASMSMR